MQCKTLQYSEVQRNHRVVIDGFAGVYIDCFLPVVRVVALANHDGNRR